MDPGEQITGTRDEHYDLVSVLYHALQGAEVCDTYAIDAEATGDERLAAFFREAQDAQTQIAQRAKRLLGIVEAPPETGIGPEDISGGVPPEGSPGDVRRGTEPDAPPPRMDFPPGPEEPPR